MGTEKAGSLVGDAMAAIARGLVAWASAAIVAGGNLRHMVRRWECRSSDRKSTRACVDTGVQDTAQRPLALALKSVISGTPDFFLKARRFHEHANRLLKPAARQDHRLGFAV
jgi:uncharacterized protein YgbK (DUF1537 family)